VKVNGKSIRIGGAVPYSLPAGGYGDVPRRKAVDDLFDKIYLDLLRKIRELGFSGGDRLYSNQGGAKDARKR